MRRIVPMGSMSMWLLSMWPTSLAVIVVLLGLSSVTQAAQSRINLSVELGPLLTLGQPEVTKDLQVATAGLHVRAALEYMFHERLSLEVAYDPNILFGALDGHVVMQQNILFGGRSRFWYNARNEYLLPQRPGRKLSAADYFSDAWLDFHVGPSLGDRTRIAYDVGIGTRLPIIMPVQLGFFVRFAQLLPGSNDENTFKQLMLGISVWTGFLPLHPEPDSDGDGVPDSQDRCPGTRPGVRVNERGCEVQSPSSSTPELRCSDTDLDGVCDGADRCPDTPLGVPVDKNGCPTIAPESETSSPSPAPTSPAQPPPTGPAEPAPAEPAPPAK